MPHTNADEIDIFAPAYVKNLFDRCSKKYILFSYMCSFGFTERWRKQCVKALPKLSSHAVGYDLMAGTGEVWPHLLKAFPDLEQITAVDISKGMHDHALERLHKMRAHKIYFIEDDILATQLVDHSADFIVSTFGLKTFNRAQQAQLAKLVAQKLKPGGHFSLIEASDPEGWILRPLYVFHLAHVLSWVERIFLKGAEDFAMINQYCQKFKNAQYFAQCLKNEGLVVNYQTYVFGCATGVSGSKPA